jgi:hypothetical protein
MSAALQSLSFRFLLSRLRLLFFLFRPQRQEIRLLFFSLAISFAPTSSSNLHRRTRQPLHPRIIRPDLLHRLCRYRSEPSKRSRLQRSRLGGLHPHAHPDARLFFSSTTVWLETTTEQTRATIASVRRGGRSGRSGWDGEWREMQGTVRSQASWGNDLVEESWSSSRESNVPRCDP